MEKIKIPYGTTIEVEKGDNSIVILITPPKEIKK